MPGDPEYFSMAPEAARSWRELVENTCFHAGSCTLELQHRSEPKRWRIDLSLALDD